MGKLYFTFTEAVENTSVFFLITHTHMVSQRAEYEAHAVANGKMARRV